MADYMHKKDCKSLEEIWNDLLRLHWNYLDTEENMEKLEMRKNLEDELKDFLCVVQHDRKFFLTETAHVLKQSIMKIDDFSAYKALIGFETISQYANNLFRKPWRKEYRCIKMFSGYYQHEVKANLIGAEKLFEAMGYTLLPNQTLILDGPICPDQVTNVSRDAMTAYVECQIMQQIFLGLTSMQLQTTWQEIFKYREMHIGSASQAISAMAYVIQERRYRKEKQLQLENCYATISAPSLTCNSTCSTSHYHPHNNQSTNCNHPSSHLVGTPFNANVGTSALNGTCNNVIYASPSQICTSNNNGQQTTYQPNYIVNSNSNQLGHPTIPHSKSLEHYHEQTPAIGHHHTRHSFDQPIKYDYNNRSHDYIDAVSNGGAYRSTNCTLNAEHLYNVSGNRYPLPANLSNQLSHNTDHYAQIANVYAQQNCNGGYSNANAYGPMPCCHQNVHFDCSNHFNSSRQTMNNDFNNYNLQSCDVHGKYYPKSINNGRSIQSVEHHLIDFDDRTVSGDVVDGPHPNQHYKYEYSDPNQLKAYYNHNDSNSKASSSKGKTSELSLSKQLKYLPQNRNINDFDGQCHANNKLYDSKRSAMTKKYSRNDELLAEYEEHLDTNDSRNSRASDFDSFDSSNNLSFERDSGGTTQSTSSKIRDGVGSYETWNYVFKNIGKNGYNKTIREPNDLTVQGLDLNAISVTNEKRRSRNLDPSPVAGTSKRSTGEPNKSPNARTMNEVENESLRMDTNSQRTSNKTNNKPNNRDPIGSSVQKSSLKQTSVNTNGVPINLKAIVPGNDTIDDGFISVTGKSKTGTIKKLPTKTLNGSLPSGKKTSVTATTTTADISKDRNAIATATPSAVNRSNGQIVDVVRTAPSEWSCKFCTYLNSAHLRICQMCYKSQDFVIDAPKPSTCV